jgi:MoaA/NifB/PqqE/SkfB family radical SAM enzyme
MKIDFAKVLADASNINAKAYANALLGYLEGFFRVAKPTSYPWKLDIVLTKACNLRCTFCISYGSLKGEHWMNFSLYEEIARRLFPTAHTVFFCSGGEPLLYPRIREALQLARKYRTMTVMVSNGTLLDQDTGRWLVQDQCLQDLMISFDGSSKKTLEGIRRGANYDTILHNLEYVTALKRARGLIYPRLSFHYIIMRSNIEELPEIFKICSRYGLYRVRVSYLNVTNDISARESVFYHPELVSEVFAKSRRRAEEYGIRLELPELVGGRGNGPKKCLWPWEFCQIDTDGSIRFCYRSWRQRIGFFTKDFRSLWQGENYQKLRRTMDSSEPFFPYCQYCPSRLGFNEEDSHIQRQHAESYVIPGLEHLQVPFNQRAEESSSSFLELKRMGQTRQDVEKLG